jgi:segregation and condensation protein B
VKKAQPTGESREMEEQETSAAESAATQEPEEASAGGGEGEIEPRDAETSADASGQEARRAEGEDAGQPMLPHVLPNPTQRRALLEAIVYVAEEPVSPEQIAEALSMPVGVVQEDLEQLAEQTRSDARGVEIRKVAGGYKIFTKAEHHEAIRGFVKTLRPKLRLSLPALETLAVVAYKQPITAPEIMDIRGVQGAGVLKTLLDRKLITTAGRKNVVGKPILYRTTKDFLVQFGLKNTSELPTLKEFEELARIALADSEEIEGIEAPEEATAGASEGAPVEMNEPEGAGTEPKGPASETAEVEEEAAEEKRAASSDE